jgi:hypothetical protein
MIIYQETRQTLIPFKGVVVDLPMNTKEVVLLEVLSVFLIDVPQREHPF